MKTLISILSIALLISLGINFYQFKFPHIKNIEGKMVYLPNERPPTIIYQTKDGVSVAVAKTIKDYSRNLENANELLKHVNSIPGLENTKQITTLTAVNSKLQVDLTEKDLVLNDAIAQTKIWKDKFNSIEINNVTNEAKATAEVSPKIATTEKRTGFLQPKETFTTVTSENPSVKFYGVESYQFKNPRHKDFLEVNAKIQGIYIKPYLVPSGGLELVLNPDGKLIWFGGYSYYYDMVNNKFVPYISAGLKYNLLRL